MLLPTNTLVLLVTCSRDETRRDLATMVTKNLASLVPQAGLQDSFAIFDNASLYKDHLAFAPAGTVIIQSSENVGYWSAIKWVLENLEKVANRTPEFIYLVESDLIHNDLRPLGECEEFLRNHAEAACVRTQEFSVRNRWRYNKDWWFLPFRNLRSVVRQKNEVTGERAFFQRISRDEKIWMSNLHAKIPALNRVELMRQVFQSLEEKGAFTEKNFFEFVYSIKKRIGIYDGGLFHQLSTPYSKKIVSGSWSDLASLKRLGYQTTRTAQFFALNNEPTMTRV